MRGLHHALFLSVFIAVPGLAQSPESVPRAIRLPVPRLSTEQALVRMAGATTAVSTANGLSLPTGIAAREFLC